MAKQKSAPGVVLVNMRSQALKVTLPGRQLDLPPHGRAEVSAEEAEAPHVSNLLTRAHLSTQPVK